MADIPCPYEFSLEHLQALWLEFQRDDAATCPVTGALITLALVPDAEPGLPTVRAHCTRCEREAVFEPEEIEGFRWAE